MSQDPDNPARDTGGARLSGSACGTGRGVRIAIIDSGVNASHPHVGHVAGGVGIGPDGGEYEDYLDRLGHGTAVTAAIREKAPEAELYAVKVFDRILSTRVEALVRAIDWAVAHRMRLVNLSLGTARPEHEEVLRAAVDRACAADVRVVSAGEQDDVRWLPGSLPGVVGVVLDWDCPREQCHLALTPEGHLVFRASGYPRPIPGVSPDRNLKGISFAVANVTGLLARTLAARPAASLEESVRLLAT